MLEHVDHHLLAVWVIGFVSACGPVVDAGDAGSAELLGEPVPQVERPIPGQAPDLAACGRGPTISDTTTLDDLSRISGYEASNTDRDCPVEPAPCGAWWIELRARGDGHHVREIDDDLVAQLVFATDPVEDGCTLHVAELVTGRFEIFDYVDTDEGRTHPIDLCAIDEHGHVAAGHIDLFLPIGRATPTRSPCP